MLRPVKPSRVSRNLFWENSSCAVSRFVIKSNLIAPVSWQEFCMRNESGGSVSQGCDYKFGKAIELRRSDNLHNVVDYATKFSYFEETKKNQHK